MWFQMRILRLFLVIFCKPKHENSLSFHLIIVYVKFLQKQFDIHNMWININQRCNILVKLKKQYANLTKIKSLYFISLFQLGTKNTLLMWNAQTPNAVHWLLDQVMRVCTFVARLNVKMNQTDHETDTTIGYIVLLNIF